jgi:hypothetical protein
MAVRVHGELDRQVTQQLLNHLGVFPGRQKNRGEAVAEIVRPDAWQVATLQERVKRASDIAFVKSRPDATRECCRSCKTA